MRTERDKAASQIWKARFTERSEKNPDVQKYIIGSKMQEYVNGLLGLKGTFEYVKNLSSQTILDIGSGSGKGVAEMSESELAKGLHFEATVLNLSSVEQEHRESVRFHATSAETLSRIKNESIAAILALNSVAYSDAPQLVAHSIDRVLLPGGVFKGSFNYGNTKSPFGKVNDPFYLQSAEELKKNLLDLNYNLYQKGTVLLAIKPPASISAEKLFKEDFDSIHSK